MWVKKVWRKNPTNQGQKDLNLETQKSDVVPKQSTHESLVMDSIAGEATKIGQVIPHKADQVEERACMPREEEDKTTPQKCAQENGKDIVPKEEE